MSTALAASGPAEFSQEQVALIKRTIARGTNDDELAMFLQVAQRTGLDPFAKQIYAIMRWDSKVNRNVMSIQVGIDGMRAIADRTGNYAPGRETVYEYKDDRLFKATAYVKKISGGAWHEIAEAAHFGGYAQDTKMWIRLPHVMLAKCAEARALRRAFPMQLSGVYAKEEMGQAEEVEEAEVTTVTEAPPVQRTLPPPAPTPTITEGAAALAFEIIRDRLNAIPGFVGDEHKEKRKAFLTTALGYQSAPRNLFSAYARAEPETQRHVQAELEKLERAAMDDVPAFDAPPAVEREPGADDEAAP